MCVTAGGADDAAVDEDFLGEAAWVGLGFGALLLADALVLGVGDGVGRSVGQPYGTSDDPVSGGEDDVSGVLEPCPVTTVAPPLAAVRSTAQAATATADAHVEKTRPARM